MILTYGEYSSSIQMIATLSAGLPDFQKQWLIINQDKCSTVIKKFDSIIFNKYLTDTYTPKDASQCFINETKS